LLVRYAVIVITSQANTTKNSDLLVNVMKTVSKQNIRLSVVFFDENHGQNDTTQALLLAQKRQSVFFLLGNNSRNFINEVTSNQ
jgi:hypothetical protein